MAERNRQLALAGDAAHGEVVTFGEPGASDNSAAAGIVRSANDPIAGPRLHVVARSTGRQAEVFSSQSGGSSVAYAPTIWARMQALDFWAVVIVLATLAISVLEAGRDLIDAQNRRCA